MRAVVPIRSSDGLSDDDVRRMMQANFDSALDARYAIAQGRLWAVFIHPLSALEKDQLISGLSQTVNLAKTYGSLYTGGAMLFGGGDSAAIHRGLIDDLLKKGDRI
jgi:HEAT repeat protein